MSIILHMKEIWKLIIGYEGCYEVSDRGRVRSTPRLAAYKNGRHRPIAGRLRAVFTRSDGYSLVRLSVCGAVHTHYVHKLVAVAFIGSCPQEKQVCHNNGIRTDNKANNLRYGTPSENQADRHKHGTALFGEKIRNAILTVKKVKQIRESNTTRQEAAKAHGVSASTIKSVRIRRTWAHV